MIRKLAIIFVVAVLVAIAAGPKLRPFLQRASATAPSGPSGSAPRAPGKGAGAAGAPLRVTATKLTAAPLAEIIGATGTLRAEEAVDLQPEINGKIVAINFQEGARAHKGDLLVKLNDADLRATLRRSAWKRELAELHERRLSRLLETNSVRQEDYDVALNELNVQRAELAVTEALIAKTEIRAPFDGVAGLRFVSEGAFVNATTRIATLQNLEQLKLDFAVPEKYASRIRPGQPVGFTVAGGDQKFHAQIYAIDPRIDPATRTVLIRARCSNPDRRLLPGGFANVEFTLDEITGALLVPAIAVVPGVSEKTVFVVVDGKAARRTVQTGLRSETSIHITEGLQAGDVVITSGLQQLRAGLPVAVVDGAGASGRPKPSGKSRDEPKPDSDAAQKSAN